MWDSPQLLPHTVRAMLSHVYVPLFYNKAISHSQVIKLVCFREKPSSVVPHWLFSRHATFSIDSFLYWICISISIFRVAELAHITMASALRDSEVQIKDASYGKTGVKILFVRRDLKRHEITEYEGLSFCLER